MATKTLASVGGDYSTFAAAIAGIATWGTLNVLDAGTYAEVSALAAIQKTVEIVNLSGGRVIIQTPVGKNIGTVSGGSVGSEVTVTWTGDFDFQARKGGANLGYHWNLTGGAGVNNKLIFNGCTFTTDYTSGLNQVIYQSAGRSHEFNNCSMVGQYQSLVTVAGSGKCISSVIDGLTVENSKYVLDGNVTTALFDTFDWREIHGQITNAPVYNATVSRQVAVSTSGLLTTSQMWGMNGATFTTFGGGTIAVEKSLFSGSRSYCFRCIGAISTGTTFRDVEFCGFTGYGVEVSAPALTGLIDYCGASNGCPALSNDVGSIGAHNQTSDPLMVDYAGGDYHLLATSPRRDAGTACIATVDPDGNAIPLGTAPDIGPYEFVDRPDVVSASGQGVSVDVRVDLAIDPATVGLPAAWTVVPLVTGGHVNVVEVAYTPGSLQIVLTLDEALTTVEAYRVTAPATLATPEGALIDNRAADFVAPRYDEAESSGILTCTYDGQQVETGEGYFELIPWGADVPGTDLIQLAYISLFTDAYVDKSELLASDTGDQAGWWADAYTGIEKIGSKLHLLRRKLPTATNIQQAQIHCLQALEWMKTDGLIAKAEVEIKRTGIGSASGTVRLFEEDGNVRVMKYADFWRLLDR